MINNIRKILNDNNFIVELEKKSISLVNVKQENTILNLIVDFLVKYKIHNLPQRESKYNKFNQKYSDWFQKEYSISGIKKTGLKRDLVIPKQAEIEVKYNYYFESDRCLKETSSNPFNFVKNTHNDIMNNKLGARNGWEISTPIIKDIFHLPDPGLNWIPKRYYKKEPDIFVWIINHRIVKKGAPFNFKNFAYAEPHNRFVNKIIKNKTKYYSFLEPFEGLISAIQKQYGYNLYGNMVTTNHAYLRSEYFFYVLYKCDIHTLDESVVLGKNEIYRNHKDFEKKGFINKISENHNPENEIIKDITT